jgi:hypothetical protein
MFTAIDKHSATDGRSVVVRSKSRDLIQYLDGDHVLLLGREGGTTPDGGPAQVVYVFEEMNWEPPYAADTISSADRAKIARNIQDAYRALGLETYIELR